MNKVRETLAAIAALAGCGGPSFPAPKSYTVVVTATDVITGEDASTNVILTVC